MKMENALVVAKKELKDMGSNRGALASTAFLAFFFGASNAMTATNASFDGLALYLGPFVGIMACLFLSGSVFFREKQTGVIETLLCTPLDLRSIWLGKVLGVTLPAYILSLMSVSLVATMLPGPHTPTIATVVILVGVVPLLIAASVGIVGFVQLALGMRENRIITLVVFIFLFAGLSSVGQIAIADEGVWIGIAVLLIASLVLLAFAALLSNRLNKERIITSIPD